MKRKNDVSSELIHYNDDDQYNFLRKKLWESMENEEFTDIEIKTDKNEKYVKHVHRIILDCFCKISHLLKISGNEKNLNKQLLVYHETNIIENIICLLYFGKCIVPIVMVSKFMDLANYLKISQIFVYDEKDSDDFLYLMNHKQKFLNYLYFIRKNNINCDAYLISRELNIIPFHIVILASYSKKLFYSYKNRISTSNPVLFFFSFSSVELEKLLQFCYFGQLDYKASELKNILNMFSLLGITRFLQEHRILKKVDWLLENVFTVARPPENTQPKILKQINEKGSRNYLYLWLDRRCFLIPLVCLKLLNFLDKNISNYNGYDVIACFSHFSAVKVRNFIYSLYTWEYSSKIETLIDLFSLEWPPDGCPQKTCSEPNCTYLYATNLEDLNIICDKVFEEKCEDDEILVQLFICQICGKELLSWRGYVKHRQEHQKQLSCSYLCDQCGKFLRWNFSYIHKKQHEVLKMNECRWCMKQYKNRIMLNKHESKCFSSFEKCTKCKKLIKKNEMEQHVKTHDDDVYECNVCSTRYRSKFWFRRHVIIHQNEKPIFCSFCNREFISRKSYQEHIHKDHGVPFRCSMCPTTLNTKLQLKEHFNERHKSKVCKTCGKEFTRYSSLKIHERIHSGEKPYPCELCGKMYRRIDSLHNHVYQIHKGRKFICPLCNKKYRTKSYFIDHCWVFHQKFIDPKHHEVDENYLLANGNEKLDYSQKEMDLNTRESENSSNILDEIIANIQPEERLEQNTDYGCPMCDKAYCGFDELFSHLESHV